MESIINTDVATSSGSSSNATLHECIKIFFESIKRCLIARTNIVRTWQSIISFFLDCFTYVRNDNKVNSPFTTHYSLVKALAFTLAETLVVMGIIGVVAALTIPNLNQSTGDREKVAKVKKIYSNLEDAFGRATAVYGEYNNWFVNNNDNSEALTNRFADRMTEFMKISKDCGSEPKGCLAEEYKSLRDNDSMKIKDTFGGFKRYFLSADGTGLLFMCFEPSSNWNECSVFG